MRLGHRLVRDERVSTHVGLTARAFGAGRLITAGREDDAVAKSIHEVSERWGGGFGVEHTPSWRSVIRDWKSRRGMVVQLTMYGLDLESVIEEIRRDDRPLMVVVGGAKVPGEVFKLADYNVAVGHQPHSEISALAVFLDRLFEGEELKREFEDYKVKVIPDASGKRLRLVR